MPSFTSIIDVQMSMLIDDGYGYNALKRADVNVCSFIISHYSFFSNPAQSKLYICVFCVAVPAYNLMLFALAISFLCE